MVSQKGSVIALAAAKVEKLAERYPDTSRARANVDGISSICRELLQRKTPILPTAALVAERGGLRDRRFPAEQTIYNAYRNVLGVWRKAYYDIMNIDGEDPITADQVAKIDTSIMDVGTGNIVNQLKAIIFELIQRINVLKHLHDVSIPVPANGVVQQLDADRIMKQLQDWLNAMADSAFDLDEIGLRVGRKIAVGTRIMKRELFDELKVFTDDYHRIRKAQNSAERQG